MESLLTHLKYSRSIARLKIQINRILKYGFLGIIKKIIEKFSIIILAILLFPLTITLFFLGFRRLCIFTDRIGHLALEPDTVIKGQILGLIKPRRWFIIAPNHAIANHHLIKYWKKFFPVHHSIISCFFLRSLSYWRFMQYDVSYFINNENSSQFAYYVNTKWSNRDPILHLSDEDTLWGDEQLIKLGIPKNAWFVCVHAREGGFSPVDEQIHDYRNGNIENLIPAIQKIVRQGGWVIRIGDSTMRPLPQLPQTIDYAHHSLKSDRLDIILCARSRFILGNTSGIFLVGTIFGVPAALANMIPFSAMGFTEKDISIPKLLWDKKKMRYLSFTEIMATPIATFRYSSLYEKDNLTAIENTSEDILALTFEMLERIQGTYVETEEEKKLQEKFISLLKPGHYAYNSSSKIATSFLKKYQDMF